MSRVGIIGYGALGSTVARILRESRQCELGAVLVRTPIQTATAGIDFVTTFDEFAARRHDVVIECAGQAALREYALPVLRSKSHLVAASIGAFADDYFRLSIDAAQTGDATVRVPSGAMAGIDGLASARMIGVDEVVYQGTMPPGNLRGQNAVLAGCSRTLVFEGSARTAALKFPKNANLTATIALAGIGFDKTRVELYVDSRATSNLHELKATGSFGELHIEVRGRAISEASPTSRIVAGSLALAALGSGHFLYATNASP